MLRLHHHAIPFVLALVTVAPLPSASAQSSALPAVAKLLARIDALSDHFESTADRQVRGTLLLLRRLDARGATDDALRTLISDAKAVLNFHSLTQRNILARLDLTAFNAITRLENFNHQRPASPSIDFDAARRQLRSLVADEIIELDRELSNASAKLDAAAPPVAPPEETPTF